MYVCVCIYIYIYMKVASLRLADDRRTGSVTGYCEHILRLEHTSIATPIG